MRNVSVVAFRRSYAFRNAAKRIKNHGHHRLRVIAKITEGGERRGRSEKRGRLSPRYRVIDLRSRISSGRIVTRKITSKSLS